ncbi:MULTISPECIES: RpiB/LacA/LacB family sugar-phosphate isomerase [unclassified Arthrobacter]|uniref:RpiB/LacA/LacB family sugar-phosphate isomerase n=1 Tax=unclassified Arthrobacter TaxID=235627 RepID=UPI001F1BD5F1|nr:RpiB/LacA/LacB family sugar-phosphate isomerase [Arthrobacter sp. FW305-BF8]UKA54459.1 RpiB/LacA/LacB family sugar-phosphate isomerase [Arthrobacter sp. FW305-BF8]
MDKQTGWRIIVGADEAGLQYKDRILKDLQSDPRVASVSDLSIHDGPGTPYPQVGIKAATAILEGRADRAVLICGTGIGMAISANKVRGVRATTVADSFSCERSVLSNDCQVIALGQRVIGLELARRLVSEWLDYKFDSSSPSRQKVALIEDFEACGGPANQ